METGPLQIAIITPREGLLTAFRHGLEARGFRVECHIDGDCVIQTARHWNLVVLDGLQVPLLEDLLSINASLHTAVMTDLEPSAFHEATEGLGVLCPLPARPDAGDVAPLLARLESVGGFPAASAAAQARLESMGRRHHPRCVVCWDRHPFGLKADYRVVDENKVVGHFACARDYEGYENILHGGIVSALLDGAMANCILAKGLEAYTVDLRIRYRSAVEVGVPATIRGEWIRSDGPLHLLQASIEQEGHTRATARGKFFEGRPNQPDQPMPGGSGVRQLLSQARKRPV